MGFRSGQEGEGEGKKTRSVKKEGVTVEEGKGGNSELSKRKETREGRYGKSRE